MSSKQNEESHNELSSAEEPREIMPEDPLADTNRLTSHAIPSGVDRRSFLMRSAVVGAAAVMTGRVVSARSRTLKAFNESLPQGVSPAPQLSNDLDVVKKGKGPVMTV